MPKRFQHSLALAVLLAVSAFGEETIVASTDVPNSLIPQGEIRLLDRGEDVVVQSLIQTRFPGKVRGKIVGSERENWPGNPDAESYISALEAAFAEYATRKKGTTLAIDFVAGSNGTRVDFSFPPDAVWRSLPLSDAYVQKNQEYILADAFGSHAETTIQILRQLKAKDVADAE